MISKDQVVSELESFFDSKVGVYFSLVGLLIFLSKTYYLIVRHLSSGEWIVFAVAQGVFLATVTTLVIRQGTVNRQKYVFSGAEFGLVMVYYARDSFGEYDSLVLSILIAAFTSYSIFSLGQLAKGSSTITHVFSFCPNCGKKHPSTSRTDRKFCSKKCNDQARKLAQS